MNTVGTNIKFYRRKNNFSQKQLANELHITRQAVSNWENGKSHPDLELLKSLAEILEIDMNQLFDEDNENVEHTSRDKKIESSLKTGISFGACLAMIISYTTWHSIPCAIIHGLMSWVYVIYYIVKY